MEGSGVDCILIEAGKYSAATTRQVFTGKWFCRGVEYHLIILMGCYELFFEAFSGSEDMQAAMETSKELRIGLHGIQSDVLNTFAKVHALFTDLFQSKLKSEFGEMGVFLRSYMTQIGSLLRLIRASREGNWELHLAAMEEQVKYYCAHDLYKYARHTILPLPDAVSRRN